MGPRIARWWRWEPTGLGPYETIRARLMSRVLVALVFVVGVQIPLQLVLPSSPWVALVPAAGVLHYLVALGLLWSGRQQAGALLVVGGGVLVFAVILVPLGGLRGTGVVHLILGALLAVTWLDPRPAAGVTALLVVVLAGAWAFGPPSEGLRMFAPGEELRLALLFSELVAIALVTSLVDGTTHALRGTSEEARQRATEAARAAETATRASDAKARFLATMSHELRTPLNAILGYAGLLREEGGPAVDDLGRIEIAGRQLLTLVDDVLEMVRADQAPRPVRVEAVELRALIDEQVATLTAPVEVRGAGPVIVYSDRVHLRRVIHLMLTNAVRHTRNGRVEIALDADPAGVRIAVRDGGLGIPRALLPLLFEPFVQLGPSSVTDRTDLGVALSQRLAHHLGGRIEVASEPGRGATFTLHLPAAR